MVPLSVVVCSVLLAFAAATEVQQCAGKSFEDLSENVQLSPCKKIPCKLKKGTDQHITIAFTPDRELKELRNRVIADVYGVPLPFIGVDDVSICDKIHDEKGEKVECPLQAGTKYIYKDSFPVLRIYPSINVKVHWALQNDSKDIICFEVPARIAA